MPRYVIYSRLSRDELRARLAEIPRIISGRIPDRLGIAHGFGLRLSVAWLSKIKQAFIVKARGGTDECGISWPPLSKEYLAYQRGPKSTRTAGKHAPGGKDGFLTKRQLKEWRQIYGSRLARFAATMPLAEAKSKAAAIAWTILKSQGAKTKLDVFGNREHEILRDRGLLFNSISPGVLQDVGADANYLPPENQVIRIEPGQIAVGTAVDYAKYHQGTDDKPGRRRIWSRPDEIPQSWLEDFNETAASGLPVAIELIAKGAA